MKSLRFIWCLVLALSAATSFASVTVTIQESGADVVAEATGSIVLPACISTASISVTGTMDFVASGNFAYVTGQGSSEGCTIGFTVAQPLHSAPISAAADSNTGAPVGVDFSAGGPVLIVPPSYASGTPISATSTWVNRTLGDLDLTPGTYVFDFGSDTITYNVVGAAAAAAVPIDNPVTVVLLMFGLIVVAFRMLRTA